MALQTKINGSLVSGIVGEFSDMSPKTARNYLVYGLDDTKGAEFGKFFSFLEKTVDESTGAVVTCAKQGLASNATLMGIFVNPKEHFTIGFKTARCVSPNVVDGKIAGTSGTIATRGHIWVYASTATVAGGKVYVDANGNLGDSSLADGTEVKGAQWLKTTRALAEGETEILSEVAIDMPSVDAGGGSQG